MTVSQDTRKRLVRTVLIASIASLLMGGIAIEYSNYAVRRSEHQWCEVVKTLNDGYSIAPSLSPTGQHLAEEFKRLNDQFNCGK